MGKKVIAHQYVLPALTLIICLACTVLGDSYLIHQDAQFTKRYLKNEALEVEKYLGREISEKLKSLAEFAYFWPWLRDDAPDAWSGHAAQLLKDFPQSFQAIEYADLSFHIRRVEPLAGNEKILGLNITGRPFSREELEAIGRSGQPRYTEPLTLKQGPRGMILYVPVYNKGEFDGLYIVVFHLTRYLKDILQTFESNYRIVLKYKDQVEYSSVANLEPEIIAHGFELPVQTFDQQWIMSIYPKPSYLEYLQDSGNRVFAISGVILSLLLTFLCHMAVRERTARRLAEQATRVKSDFLANMSHEIRTPMNGVLGMMDLLNETELDSSQKDLVETALYSADSLLTIINDILDFSKIEAGKIQFNPVNFCLREFLSNIEKIHQYRMSQREISFIVHVAADIPEWLYGDDHRLQQVIVNLVGNAAKFTKPGGSIILQVHLQARTDKEVELLFTVTDTGIGIPEKQQQQIFEAFSQADSSITREYGGTGLGLAISKNLIGMMGGKIGLKSRAGSGSNFFFSVRLPLGRERSEPAQEYSAGHDSAGLDVLVAEDNLVNQKLISKILEKEGYRVTLAVNGIEALQLYEKKHFDIILMDLQMPAMGGEEATVKLRERGATLPIVALTAHALNEYREKTIAAGMDGFVTKPIKRAELFRVIQEVVRTKA